MAKSKKLQEKLLEVHFLNSQDVPGFATAKSVFVQVLSEFRKPKTKRSSTDLQTRDNHWNTRGQVLDFKRHLKKQNL